MKRSKMIFAQTTLLLLACIAIAGPASAFPIKFTVIDLGTLWPDPNHPGNFIGTSDALGINSKGQVVGYCFNESSGAVRATLWQNGKPFDIDPAAPLGAIAFAINAFGQVVGAETESDKSFRAFLWTPPAANTPPGAKAKGTITYLVDTLNLGGNSAALAINDSGQITGTAGSIRAVSIGVHGVPAGHVFLWTPAVANGTTGTPTDLFTPGNAFAGVGMGISAAGVIAGTSVDQFGNPIDCYTYTNAWNLVGHADGSDSSAAAAILSGAEQVLAGTAYNVNGQGHTNAFIYLPPDINGPELWELCPPLTGYMPADTDSEALAMSTRLGLAVGISYSDQSAHAALFRGTGSSDLTALISKPPLGIQLMWANGINDQDQIVGMASYGQNIQYAYLLTPVPRKWNLPVLPFTPSGLVGLSGNGQAAGSGHNSAGDSIGLMFSDGVTTTVPPLSGDTDSALTSLNNAAEAVGSSWYLDTAGDTVSQTLLYANGYESGLSLGISNFGTGINSADDLCGAYDHYDPYLGLVEHGFLYQSGTATVLDLGTLGGNNSQAMGLNDNDQATGQADTGALDSTGNPISHAFLYNTGSLYDVGTLGGNNSQGNAINAAADIAGWSQLPADALGNTATHAFLYLGAVEGSGLFDLGTLMPDGSGNSVANGINGYDDMVGDAWYTKGSGHHAFIAGFMGSSSLLMFDLNSFLPSDVAGVVTSALGINDNGTIVGTMQVLSGTTFTTVGYIASPIKLVSLKVSPSLVVGGKSLKATVALSDPAPAGGVLMALTNTNTAALAPLSVRVPAGAMSAAFTIKTFAVTALTQGTVSATLGDTTLSASLNVRPIGVKSVSLSPNPVVGGSSVIGTVTLEAAAAPGDITVTLSSSNTHVAYPTTTSITIPAGQTKASFTVNTLPVSALTKVKITATANSISKSATLTVDP